MQKCVLLGNGYGLALLPCPWSPWVVKAYARACHKCLPLSSARVGFVRHRDNSACDDGHILSYLFFLLLSLHFAEEDRTTGAQFITNKQRVGQTGDNWNRGRYGRRIGVQRLYEGEKYVDPFKHETKAANEERAKNLTTNGFRYSSPNKWSSGLGNYYGCIGPKFQHMPDFNVLTKEVKPGPVVHELRQVLTNPPKRGYGATTPGCIFGPGPKAGEPGMGKYGGREYLHMKDEYDLARQKESAERKSSAEALLGRPPFKTVSHAVDFFDGHNRVASSKVYTEDPRVPARPPPAETGAPVAERAFYPSRAPRSGPLGTFTKFPEYLPDPLEEKLKKAKEAAAAARIVGAAPFKPTSKPHTTPMPSIVFHITGPKPMS